MIESCDLYGPSKQANQVCLLLTLIEHIYQLNKKEQGKANNLVRNLFLTIL